MGIRVAIIGATGAVGKVFLQYLEESDLQIDETGLYASAKSEGKVLHFRDKPVRIMPLRNETVKEFDYAFCTVSSSVSREFVPLFREKGAVCIDDSSCFRMHPDVPIIVPEVNKDALASHKGIISIPNCVVAGIVVVLKPLVDEFGVTRVIASTYQSVSGAGQKAADELEDRTRSYIFKENLTQPEQFEKDILFNVLPKIPHRKSEPFYDNGYTEEEDKLIKEVGKIMNNSNIRVTATCVRVPVFVSHSVALNVELVKHISISGLTEAIKQGEGIIVLEDDFTTPREAEGKEEVFVSRIRQDNTNKNAYWMWVVTDNLRKGAAYNAFQILKILNAASDKNQP